MTIHVIFGGDTLLTNLDSGCLKSVQAAATKYNRLDCLMTKVYLSQSWRLGKSKVKVPADLGAGRAHFLGPSGHLLTVPSHSGRGEGALRGVSGRERAPHSCGLCSQDLITI